MVNLKIVLLGFYFPASVFLAVYESKHLTITETVAWAMLISFIGGASAAYRTTNDLNILAKSALNTTVLGAVIALGATYWTLDHPAYNWLAIALSGLLSLGGLASIDWVIKVFRKQAEKKLQE